MDAFAEPPCVVIDDLAPGEHAVPISDDGRWSEHRVKGSVESGAATSVMFSLPKRSGPSAGRLTVSSPFDVLVFEGGELVSTRRHENHARGRYHDLRLVSEPQVRGCAPHRDCPGAVKMEPPKATLSANARPWAELIIDGTSVGQTRLANISVAIGMHQVISRHPQPANSGRPSS